MIGRISTAYQAGRRDRKAGLDPASAKDRQESVQLHAFYVMGWKQGWKQGEGFPQLEIPGLTFKDARAPHNDAPLE